MIYKYKVNLLFFIGDVMVCLLVDVLVKGNDYDLLLLFLLVSIVVLFLLSIKEKFFELLLNWVIMDLIGLLEMGFGGISVVVVGQVYGGGFWVWIDYCIVVFDDDGNEVKFGLGMWGVIVKKGNIFVGYYKDEKKMVEMFWMINGVCYVILGDYV